MWPRVVERGGLKNARVSHGGRGAGAGGRRGDALTSSDAGGRRSGSPCLYQQRACLCSKTIPTSTVRGRGAAHCSDVTRRTAGSTR
jgi:hypothetical protein